MKLSKEELLAERALFKSCPKYEACSVNICPLWSNVLNVGQLDNEPTCPYCRDVSRNQTENIPEHLRERIISIYPKMIESCGSEFRKKMKKSAGRTTIRKGGSQTILPTGSTVPDEDY